MNHYLVLFLLWTGLILFATLTPGDRVPDSFFPNIPYFDKIVHIGLFSVQSFLMIKSFPEPRKHSLLKIKKMVFALLICLSIAVFVEFMQKFVPGRSYELADLIANILGILLGLTTFEILNKFYG